MQNYNPIQPTGLISADREKINHNIESVMSHFSGNAFPTTNLQVGMYCWRTDLKKMYQLNADLVNWTLVNDMSQGYNSVAHATNADYATKDGDGNVIKNTYYKQNSLADLKKALFPVGAVYITMTNTNPSTFLGGTWQQIAAGRTLIGASSSYTAGSTGGSESQSITLTTANMPSHTHTINDSAGGHSHSGTTGSATISRHYHVFGHHTADNSGYFLATSGGTSHTQVPNTGRRWWNGSGHGGGYETGSITGNMITSLEINSTGTEGSHSHTFNTSTNGAHNHTINANGSSTPFSVNHMQPYLVCYFWQRVS